MKTSATSKKLFLITGLVVIRSAMASDLWITDVKGGAAVVAGADQKAGQAVVGMPLENGDTVVTRPGSDVEVASADGNLFQLRENTSLRLPTAPNDTSYLLRRGRLLAHVAPIPADQQTIRVQTPTTVGSTRGTDVALDVADDGTTNGAVADGETTFEPTPSSTASVSVDVGSTTASIGSNQAVHVQPNQSPERQAEIPAALVARMKDLSSLRARVPALREQLKTWSRPEKKPLREKSLRDGLTWKSPETLEVAHPLPPTKTIPRPMRRALRPSNASDPNTP